MKAFWLFWVGVGSAVLAQQPSAPGNGDIFVTRGNAPDPQSSFRDLYRLTAQITADPSAGYQPPSGDQTGWPAVAAAQQRWFQSMAQQGNELTPAQRNYLVPCAAHLNAAIDDMERGYRIKISQTGSPLAQRTVLSLFAKGRAEFAECRASQSPPGNTGNNSGTSPGNQPTQQEPPPASGPNTPPSNTLGNSPGNQPQFPDNWGRPQNAPPPTRSCPSNVVGFGQAGQDNWVGSYNAQGALPPLRYQVGFNQGVARCLQDQCTVQNLAIAIWAARFGVVRSILGLSGAAISLEAVINPPGFSPSADIGDRGREEGSRLCNWLLRLAAGGAKVRGEEPVVGPGGTLSKPPGFSFGRALASISRWLPEINPSRDQRNCGACVLQALRVLLGKGLDPVAPVEVPMTEEQMAARLGVAFTQTPATDVEMNAALSRYSNGTLFVISAENTASTGQLPPPGPITDPNAIPGHFLLAVKNNNTVDYWDPSIGGPAAAPSGVWIYRWAVIGNPLRQ